MSTIDFGCFFCWRAAFAHLNSGTISNHTTKYGTLAAIRVPAPQIETGSDDVLARLGDEAQGLKFNAFADGPFLGGAPAELAGRLSYIEQVFSFDQ